MTDEVLRLPGGVRARIQVSSEDSGGAFLMLTDEAPPGWALPPHRHLNESETVHVTDGALWMEIAGQRTELAAGDTVHIPRGTLHAGGTLGDAPVRRVIVFAPGGLEAFFRQVGGSDDPAGLAAQHGWRF